MTPRPSSEQNGRPWDRSLPPRADVHLVRLLRRASRVLPSRLAGPHTVDRPSQYAASLPAARPFSSPLGCKQAQIRQHRLAASLVFMGSPGSPLPCPQSTRVSRSDFPPHLPVAPALGEATGNSAAAVPAASGALRTVPSLHPRPTSFPTPPPATPCTCRPRTAPGQCPPLFLTSDPHGSGWFSSSS